MNRSHTLPLFLILFGIILLSGHHFHEQPAEAAYTATLAQISIHEDTFWNWDFTMPFVGDNLVDWPVNILFWNNAEVDKVKSRLGPFMPYTSPTAMRNQVQDAIIAGPVWDQDAGAKSVLCPVFNKARHTRIYADGDDRLVNMSWGYYVIATSHEDINECGGPTQFGYSERTEEWIADEWADEYGADQVIYSWSLLNFQNQENMRMDGNRVVDNNGLATVICVE